MTKHTIIATAVAAVAGAGAAAGAGALAAPAKPCPGKEVRAVRQDVRAAVKKARQTAFTGADRVAAAKPILDQAVKDGKIKAEVETKVLQRIERGPRKRRP